MSTAQVAFVEPPTQPKPGILTVLGIAALALLSIACGCTPATDYVRADAETYHILSPYTTLGINTAALTAEERGDLHNLVQSWEARIRLAGGVAK